MASAIERREEGEGRNYDMYLSTPGQYPQTQTQPETQGHTGWQYLLLQRRQRCSRGVQEVTERYTEYEQHSVAKGDADTPA